MLTSLMLLFNIKGGEYVIGFRNVSSYVCVSIACLMEQLLYTNALEGTFSNMDLWLKIHGEYKWKLLQCVEVEEED